MEGNQSPETKRKRELERRFMDQKDSIPLSEMWKDQITVPHNFPTTIRDFEQMVTTTAFFVDKTMLIKEIITFMGPYNLILRPWKCGKSLLITMIKAFFKKIVDNETGKELQSLKVLFTGGTYQGKFKTKTLKCLKIAKHWSRQVDYCQGKFPLILIDFQQFKPKTDQQFVVKFGLLMSTLIKNQFAYLQQYLSNQQNYDYQLKDFILLKNNQASDKLVKDGLFYLIQWLNSYHKTRVMLLVDQFDKPIMTMHLNRQNISEIKKMERTFTQIFQRTLKGSCQIIYRTILIGTRDVAAYDDCGCNYYNYVTYNLRNDYGLADFDFIEEEIQQLVRNVLQVHFSEKYSDQIKEKTAEIMGRMRKRYHCYNGYDGRDKQTFYHLYSVIRYLKLCTEIKMIVQPPSFFAKTQLNEFFKRIKDMYKKPFLQYQLQPYLQLVKQLKQQPQAQISKEIKKKEGIPEPPTGFMSKNFDYEKVGSNLPGVIGQYWKKPQECPLVMNFKKMFINGFDLYCCTLEQILKTEGMEEEYASVIDMSLKKSRLLESNFVKSRISAFTEKEKQKSVAQFLKKIEE